MELTDITVIDDCYTVVTREARRDEWDRNDTATYHEIRGIQISDRLSDIQVGFKVKKDTPYYLVYAVYSTGDSFGHDDGAIQFIDLFEIKEAAEACRKAAIADADYSYKYMNEFLEWITSSRPWTDYFSGLDDVYVKEVYLET